MRDKYEPQGPQVLAEPREARPSGEVRVTSDADAPGEDGLRLGFSSKRRNVPLPVLPSIIVDASYLQVVSAVRARRRRSLVLATVGAFLFGALAAPLAVQLLRMAQPATPTLVVGAATVLPRTQAVPVSASPVAAPPHRVRMELRDAATLVRRAERLRRAGRVDEARPLLTSVLNDRPGYPHALAAVAALELDSGRPVAAVRWARHAVRSLPWSVENWELLSRACTAAGLHAESSRAQIRAVQLTHTRHSTDQRDVGPP